MAQYLLTIVQPDGDPPPDIVERLPRMIDELEALIGDMKAGGAWVFNGALHPPSTATVVRVRDGDVLLTDGPFAEGKEHIGGLFIVEASDLDGALAWARRAADVITLPIEVRPFQDR